MNIKIKYISIVASLFMSVASIAQVPLDYATNTVPAGLPQLLAGKSVCIDPGHGGYNADNDREIPFGHGITYWESLGNFKTSNYLYAQLEALGCDVSITRQNNDTDGNPISDPSTSERVAFSELMDADFFQSVHTNAGTLGGSANYTLMLYASLNSSNRTVAEFTEAKRMAEIESVEIPKVVYTNSSKVYADLVFQPKWNTGYGILNGHSIPAIISESAFHTNYSEAARLHCNMYQEGMAMQMTKSYLRYFYADAPLNFGEIKGIVAHATDEDYNGVTVGAYQDGTLVKEVTTDDGYNGYYFMGWMAPGEYEIKFSKGGTELSSKTVTVVKMADIEERPTTPTAPSKVVLKSVRFDEDGKVEFSWNKLVNNFVGYRIYYSESASLDSWKLALNESLLTTGVSKLSSNKVSFIRSTSATTLYFKIVGVNKNGSEEIEGQSSKVYSILSGDGNKKILVVDGFDRRAGVNSFSNHALSASYINSLSKLSFVSSATTVDNSSIIDGSVDMVDYDVVFWISGEESTTDETFNSTEQSKVKTFLETGGKLVVSGAELGWDLGRSGKSSVADVAFYTDYLKSVYKNDGSTSFGNSVGTSSTVFDGADVAFNNANGWEVKFPDGISPVTGAESLMDYASGGYGSTIGYLGTFGSGEVDGGIVHFSFPIGATVQSDTDILIAKSIEYLQVSALSNDDYFTNELTVYPNPVRDFVTISGVEFNQEFDVTIYSTIGNVIYKQSVTSVGGNISINSSSWNKGIYLLEIRHDNSRVVKKLLKQ